MELSIGLKLFDRGGGALKPTENALILIKEVAEVFHGVDRVNLLIDKLKVPSSRRIAFIASPSLGLRLIPSAIRKFQSRHKNVLFSYQTSMVKEMPTELLGKTSEFCLSIWPIDHPNLNCESIFTGKMGLVVHQDSPLAEFETISVRQLAEYPVILYLEDMPISALIRNSLESHNVKLVPTVEVGRAELACALVNEKLGVTLVHNFSMNERMWNNLVMKEIDIDIPISIYLITSRFSVLSEDSMHFIETIRREANTMGPCPIA
jgi:DNA-binding transcriptional LysR family regulator